MVAAISVMPHGINTSAPTAAVVGQTCNTDCPRQQRHQIPCQVQRSPVDFKLLDPETVRSLTLRNAGTLPRRRSSARSGCATDAANRRYPADIERLLMLDIEELMHHTSNVQRRRQHLCSSNPQVSVSNYSDIARINLEYKHISDSVLVSLGDEAFIAGTLGYCS